MSRASQVSRGFDLLEKWLQQYPGLTTAIVLTLGFLLRLHAASGTFLEPDEALHFWAANRTSLSAAYQGSLHLSHPPLLVFVLYFWRWLGTSEIVLRLPAVFTGTAFCWVAFKWIKGLFGRAAGWTGLIFLTFLPPMIALSSEIRQYALMLVFVAGAAYFLERAFAANSAKWMLTSFAFLYLGLLSHYSAFLFAATIGIYAILRFVSQRFSVTLIAVWIVGQLGGLGIAGFLYVTHLSRLEQLQGVQASNWLPTAYLPNSYFHGGSRALWALSRTGSIFQYLFGQRVIGVLAFLFFLVAIGFLLRRKLTSGKFDVDVRLLGCFLLFPFVVESAAAFAKKYPYGGTRHSAFILMFALAGISALMAGVLKQRASCGLVAAFMIAVTCNCFAWRHQPDLSRIHMDEVVEFIDQRISPADAIFVDNQTGLVLGHYLCRQKPFDLDRSVPNFRSFECGGHRIISTGGEDFWFTTDNFFRRWQEMIPRYGVKPEQKVWIIQAGENADLARELSKVPAFQDLKVNSFGKNISIFKLRADQAMPDPAKR